MSKNDMNEKDTVKVEADQEKIDKLIKEGNNFKMLFAVGLVVLLGLSLLLYIYTQAS